MTYCEYTTIMNAFSSKREYITNSGSNKKYSESYKEGVNVAIDVIKEHYMENSCKSIDIIEYNRIQSNLCHKMKNIHYANNKEEAYNNSILACKSVLHSLYGAKLKK